MSPHLLRTTLFTTAFLCAACQPVLGDDASLQATPAPQVQTILTPINGLAAAQIELAVTEAQKQTGLMNRASLPANAGMLFYFESEHKPCFWMKNTLIPLTIGFIDAQGVLQQTIDMQAHSLEPRCAAQPTRYAVEMNQGWFARNNVVPGTQVLNISKQP